MRLKAEFILDGAGPAQAALSGLWTKFGQSWLPAIVVRDDKFGTGAWVMHEGQAVGGLPREHQRYDDEKYRFMVQVGREWLRQTQLALPDSRATSGVSPQPSATFDGYLYTAKLKVLRMEATDQPVTGRDIARIGGDGIVGELDILQFRAAVRNVFKLMSDGRWHTRDEINMAAGREGRPANEGLRRMRELRPRYRIERERVDPKGRYYKYRLVLAETPAQPQEAVKPDKEGTGGPLP